jgi:hypothetical protein
MKSSRSIEQWLNDFNKLKSVGEVDSDSENNGNNELNDEMKNSKDESVKSNVNNSKNKQPVITKRKLIKLVSD